jgi:hypothetical protein
VNPQHACARETSDACHAFCLLSFSMTFGLRSARKTERYVNLTVERSNHATVCREIVPGSLPAGVSAGKIAVIFVPKALELTVNSP